MSPLWLIGNLLVYLNIKTIIHVHVVRRCLTVIEVGERSIVVRVSGVVSPFWLVFGSGLDIETIITVHIVWASLTVVEVISWSIVIGVAGVVSPFWLILLGVFVVVGLGVMSSVELHG